MDSSKPDKLGILPVSETSKESGEKREIRETGEVREAASNVVRPTLESKEGAEGAVEFSEGKVAEQTGEDKKKASGARAAQSLTADEVEAIRAKLLANLPTQEVMMKQIEKKLSQREKSLNKDYKKLKRMGHKAAFQLARIVAQMRKVHEYLALLANATFEVIKQMWLKIVHGV